MCFVLCCFRCIFAPPSPLVWSNLLLFWEASPLHPNLVSLYCPVVQLVSLRLMQKLVFPWWVMLVFLLLLLPKTLWYLMGIHLRKTIHNILNWKKHIVCVSDLYKTITYFCDYVFVWLLNLYFIVCLINELLILLFNFLLYFWLLWST